MLDIKQINIDVTTEWEQSRYTKLLILFIFTLYDLFEQAETEGIKVNNYALAKQVGIEVEQRNTEEEWDVAYKRRVVSIAVSRKKKVAVDTISNAVKGVFPQFTMLALRLTSISR